MSKQFWENACKATLRETPRDQAISLGAVMVILRNYTAASAAKLVTSKMLPHTLPQSASCVAAAAASGWMFRRWWLLDSYDRGCVWKHYGWFCGLMCIGCCSGAVSYAAWAQWLAGLYASLTDQSKQAILSYATALRWLIAYALTYPVTLCCSVVTKLLVIDRLVDFSKLTAAHKSRWALLGRVSVGIIVLGNAIGMCGNITAAVFFSRSAAFQESQAMYFGIDQAARNNENQKAIDSLTTGMRFAAVHMAFEAIMLLLIVIAVLIVGVASARRIRAASSSSTRMLQEAECKRKAQELDDRIVLTKLKRQITTTCVAVFVSFLIRAAYSTMFTLSNALQNDFSNCTNSQTTRDRCGGCYDVPYFIVTWMMYTPALYYGTVIICQPVTLMIALWGMTSDRLIFIMRTKEQETP